MSLHRARAITNRKSRKAAAAGIVRKDVQCPKGRLVPPEPDPPGTFLPKYTPFCALLGRGSPRVFPQGAQGWSRVQRSGGWHPQRHGLGGWWHGMRTTLLMAGHGGWEVPSPGSPRSGMGNGWCTARARGYSQGGQDRRTHPSSLCVRGVWCPQSSTTAPREASHLDPSASGPSPMARSRPSLHAPWVGTGTSHGRLQRAPITPHQPCWRCLWRQPRILRESGLHPQAQDRGSLAGSETGAAGGPAEPSCGDVAGMCVGGRQGGGEGGRGSGRGSSSFDKQLPEHFQTVVLDQHARRLRACAGTDGAHATGQQVGSPPARPCCPLERGPPPGSAGPWRPWAVGMCLLLASPGQGWDAGQGDGDTLPAGAGSWGSSQGPPACQGLGWGISQVFSGRCARGGCWSWSLLLSLARISSGAAAPGEQPLLPHLVGGQAPQGVLCGARGWCAW